jgi:hypothetical protein
MAHTRSLDPPHCFYNTIDVFNGCLYPQPRYTCGKLSNNEFGKTIRIPLERDMRRRINAPFDDCCPIRFDTAMRINLNPTRSWVVFNPLDPSHDQPVTGRGAGYYKPVASDAACASAY